MSAEAIIQQWKSGVFKPVYWLEGDEPFYIDEVMSYAEKHLLKEEEKGFNLSIFYGKDADLAAVVGTCRKYPMNAERQVVLLKEAQQMKDLERLELYVDKPLNSTILVVGFKEKKLDGRKAFTKKIASTGVLFTTKKIYDNELPSWIVQFGKSKGISFAGRSAMLLVEHIGNDLSRLAQEIQKILPNLGSRKQVTEDDVEAYVGISKEYNIFELQQALQQRNMTKCLTLVQYFGANSKATPIHMIIPALYAFFSKAYLVFGLQTNNDYEMAAALGYNAKSDYFKNILGCAKNYRQKGVENAILIMHEYNLRSLGINGPAAEDGELLKEMVVKMIYAAG